MFKLIDREYKILGTKIHALQPMQAVSILDDWSKDNTRFRYMTSTNLNNIWEAQESQEYYQVMKCADISLPDGIPVIWQGRRKGYDLPERCGIEEVMLALFEESKTGKGHAHFFYGNTIKVLEQMKKNLLAQYPNLTIVGTFSPPFRTLSPEEEEEHIDLINAAKPDFLWVSLGCPKQELWLYRNREKLGSMIGGGAGAVFNFISGETKKAPKWIQYSGLEWLMRLYLSPKRLYQRYLVKYPKCVWNWMLNRPADHIKDDQVSIKVNKS